jgi:uncharacterized membrane protein YkoI
VNRTSISTIVVATIASLAAAAAVAATPAHFSGAKLTSQAKVTLPQARAIALKARPGRIVDQELEKEAGGTGLRYSFDVKAAGRTYEVGVDAATGRVLENGSESRAAEAAEAKSGA